jgi:ribonuclease HI
LDTKRFEIYTDGSCHTQKKIGAWASILKIDGEKIVLKGEVKNTTHNRMELVAVIEALNYIDKNEYDAQLEVYTDSQYVCGILNRKEKLKNNRFLTKKGTSIQNADLVETLIQQIESHSIRFIKVKAHQKADTESSKYNGQVDKLSRKLVRGNVKGV